MRFSIKSRNGAVTESVKTHAEKKVQKLERYFHSVQSVQMQERTERGQHVVELNLEGDGVFLRSEERCADLTAAVDGVVEKMERQAKRFKSRLIQGHHRPGPYKDVAAQRSGAENSHEEEEPFVPRIVKRKQFPLKPMPSDEAARQMELVDHSFFLFHNQDTGEVNLLYKRRDGDYGLIEPEN